MESSSEGLKAEHLLSSSAPSVCCPKQELEEEISPTNNQKEDKKSLPGKPALQNPQKPLDRRTLSRQNPIVREYERLRNAQRRLDPEYRKRENARRAASRKRDPTQRERDRIRKAMARKDDEYRKKDNFLRTERRRRERASSRALAEFEMLNNGPPPQTPEEISRKLAALRALRQIDLHSRKNDVRIEIETGLEDSNPETSKLLNGVVDSLSELLTSKPKPFLVGEDAGKISKPSGSSAVPIFNERAVLCASSSSRSETEPDCERNVRGKGDAEKDLKLTTARRSRKSAPVASAITKAKRPRGRPRKENALIKAITATARLAECFGSDTPVQATTMQLGLSECRSVDFSPQLEPTMCVQINEGSDTKLIPL